MKLRTCVVLFALLHSGGCTETRSIDIPAPPVGLLADASIAAIPSTDLATSNETLRDLKTEDDLARAPDDASVVAADAPPPDAAMVAVPDMTSSQDLRLPCPQNPPVTEVDVPWVAPDTFFDGMRYAYFAFNFKNAAMPAVVGGTNVTVSTYLGLNAAPTTFVVYSNSPVQSISVGQSTRAQFVIVKGKFFWRGVWNAFDVDWLTTPSHNTVLISVGLTENKGPGTWFSRVDANFYRFSCNVAIHYTKRMTIDTSEHLLVGAGHAAPVMDPGIEWAYYGYGN